MASVDGQAREIASEVYWLPVGKGLLRGANVYFARSGSSWCLIDAGWPRDAATTRRAAASLFGPASRPDAILLTHDHPDHAGAAKELAREWDCPVWVHAAEYPLAIGDVGAIRRFAAPLDRFVILPALRVSGRRRMQDVLSRSSLEGIVRPLDAPDAVPGLEGWEALHTPGHTPGHVAFVRAADHVALTGDALLTLDLNSVRGLVSRKQTLAAARGTRRGAGRRPGHRSALSPPSRRPWSPPATACRWPARRPRSAYAA